jgi:MoaA/NifB/PqqE/SkfB family radical SAM enzyme
MDNYQKDMIQRTPGLEVTIREGIESEFTRTYDRCYGMDFMCEVLSDGRVNLCNAHKHDDAFTMGNVFEDSFRRIWEDTKIVRGALCDCYPDESCMDWCRHHKASEFLWALKHKDWRKGFI